MVAIFIVTTLLTSFTNIFIQRTSDNLILKMDEMFSANIKLDEFVELLLKIDENLVDYLFTDNSESLLNYHKKKDEFRDIAYSMFENTKGVYSQEDLIYKDILYMVDSYIVETDAAVAARLIDDGNEYSKRYTEASIIAGYIKTYADKLNLNYLDTNTTQYLSISQDLSKLMFMNIVLLVSVICLNLMIIVYIAYNLTSPIIKLAHSADEIAKGNFDADDIEVQTDDEINVLANAFNDMKHSIKKYIIALKDKADTETQLFEQKIENLEMQSLLDVAELKALQMQINPHFLFNTLNAAVQLATIEGADRTSVFLDDISKIFRYNVKSLDRVVKISEEIEMVRSYGSMFVVRFGDKVNFDYELEENIEDFYVPPLIIQPFVENSTIHGVGDMEKEGRIVIRLYKDNDIVKIEIQDNGVGMTEEIRQKILSGKTMESKSSGHTTGIGIQNVVQRLQIFFGTKDVIELESKVGFGTKVTLKIPVVEQKNNEQGLDTDV